GGSAARGSDGVRESRRLPGGRPAELPPAVPHPELDRSRRRCRRRQQGEEVMARERVVYRCQTCGFASSKAGTCPDCARQGEYLALVEERPQASKSARPALQPGARPQRLADIRLE